MTKVSAAKVLSDSTGIENVWKANPDMTLGKNGETVTLADYQAAKKAVTDQEALIADARTSLAGLLDKRDDAARALSLLNTRARSVVRGNFGPDSSEYDQAGGTRSSERKHPTRKPKTGQPNG